jgi:hypothetical protein
MSANDRRRMDLDLAAKRGMNRVEVCNTEVEPPRPRWVNLLSARARQMVMFKRMKESQRLTVLGC